jgi:putative component of membrane protein insertase Oxa1/YidC/SpoIIIJ protein YidD
VKHLPLFFLLASCCLGEGSDAFARGANHVLFALTKIKPSTIDKKEAFGSAIHSTNEFKTIGLSLIRLYQTVISSQDRPACLFSKSCSRFAATAIDQRGFVVGVLMTADRLQRCNELARHYYPEDPLSGLSVDPIVQYFLANKREQ